MVFDSEEENAAKSSTLSAIGIYEGGEKKQALAIVSFQEALRRDGKRREALQPADSNTTFMKPRASSPLRIPSCILRHHDAHGMANRKRKAGDEPRKTLHKKRRPAQRLPPLEPTFRLTSLPPELQTLIWKFAVSAIPARRVRFKMRSPYESAWFGPELFSARPAIPAPLHACRLSRGLAMQRWQLLRACPQWQNWAYFDMEADTLAFADMETLNWFYQGSSDKWWVRNVELEWRRE